MTSSDLLTDLQRSGPEALGPPLRAVAVLARDTGQLLAPAGDPLGHRRRRASAARVARAALSFAASTHGAFGDRPEARIAWSRGLRALGERTRTRTGDGGGETECARALERVAGLALLLPTVGEDEDWQVGAIAFADEGTLEELHGACLDLAAAAVAVAASG